MKVALTLDRDADLSETNDYLRALVAAGLARETIAVVTPLAPAVGPFDALVLGGGVDVDPARYGRPVLENGSVEVDPERDALDFELFERARRGGAPVLGICRGLQVVNVALGGTLVQDIPSERPSPVVHQRTKDEKARRDHQVAIAPGTRLSAIAGAPEAAVNSRHHQAIDEVAPGLAVSAVAPDGVAEAVESTGEAWVLAVQWHPENLAGDPFSERLFAEFLRTARARSGGLGNTGRPRALFFGFGKRKSDS
ncbi:MAG TPA: gamma-glutamyl-gamma-aminobutyrate hydrolase family protein [Thermoanaerobaculia bacterium]|jgi:putative glutamine amidotransferase